MDDRNGTGSRSSEEIRAEIDRTRAEMHNTVDQLEARLSPGQILDELWGRMRQGGAGSAGELVRDHPVPLALMGLGVAMLAVEHSKHSKDGSAHGYVGSTDRAEGRRGPYRGDDVDHIKFSELESPIGTTTDTGSEGSGIKDRVAGALHDAKDAVSGRAGETASSAFRGLDRVIHDQPLIAGAITFGLGLAAGLAVPATRFEDERLGRTADQLKDSAKEAASQVGEKALEVASQTASAVKDAAVEIKDEINDPQLKDALLTKARSVADLAKTAVGDTMDNVSGALAAKPGSDTGSGEDSRAASDTGSVTDSGDGTDTSRSMS